MPFPALVVSTGALSAAQITALVDTLVIILIFMLVLVNDRELMGEYANGRYGWLLTIVLAAAAVNCSALAERDDVACRVPVSGRCDMSHRNCRAARCST